MGDGRLSGGTSGRKARPRSADPDEAEAARWQSGADVQTQHLGSHFFGGRAPVGGLWGQSLGDLVGDDHPQLGHTWRGRSFGSPPDPAPGPGDCWDRC
jgi:hypothetical protein